MPTRGTGQSAHVRSATDAANLARRIRDLERISAGGSGLTGLADRVAALGGRLTITTPVGGGTTIRADLPCA